MPTILNPWVILAFVLALAGAGVGGAKIGSDHQIAKRAKTEDLIAAVKEEAQLGAAAAIANNRPVNQFNKQVLEREIRTNTVYAECAHTPDGLSAINGALQNKRAESPGRVGMPGADTDDR